MAIKLVLGASVSLAWFLKERLNVRFTPRRWPCRLIPVAQCVNQKGERG
jgi:hypothetical protein